MQNFAGGALVLEAGQPVATLTLRRPERRNAINAAMWLALPEIAAAVDSDEAIKVLLVRGAGGHFGAGADIGEFAEVTADRERAGAYAASVHDGLEAFSLMAKPAIAVIEGFCIGGGTALALACDIRLAAEGARFGVTPAKLGIVYNMFDTRMLVDAVGASAAKDLLFTGRMVGAPEAHAMGLIDQLRGADALDAAAAQMAAEICANSQWSVRQAKRQVRRALDGQARDDEITRKISVDSFTGEDFAEGRAAFAEKRRARFSYR
jgi:enoyl-CoA hydratase/carnithine racemase